MPSKTHQRSNVRAMLAVCHAVFVASCGGELLQSAQEDDVAPSSGFASMRQHLRGIDWHSVKVPHSLALSAPANWSLSRPIALTELMPEVLPPSAETFSPSNGEQVFGSPPIELIVDGDFVLAAGQRLLVPGSLHLVARHVKIEPGAEFHVAGDLFIDADRYTGKGKVTNTSSRDLNVVVDGRRGRDGFDGLPGATSIVGYCCWTGACTVPSTGSSSGGDGTNGENGGPARSINIATRVLTDMDVISARGGDGGRGGNGGNGGSGADAICCAFACSEATTASKGGNAGHGGDGGDGGTVKVYYCKDLTSPGWPGPDVSGGASGKGGTGGRGGKPGGGVCFWGCGTNHPYGATGASGRDGAPGAAGTADVKFEPLLCP